MRVPLTDAGPTDERPPFRFSLRTSVILADTDAIGIVYYGSWTRFVEQAALAYRDHLGLVRLREPNHEYLIRAFSISYHGSARMDDEIELFVRCARLGGTSHTFALRIERRGPQPIHLADAELVIVGVDGHGPEAVATPIPDAVRARIREFEGDAVESSP